VNVIVGTGLAAVRAAEALREAGSSEPIVLVGAEHDLPYERPPLSKQFLRGEATLDDTRLHDEAFYRTHEIELVLGSAARSLNVHDRTITLDRGREIPFRQLLIATGSVPRRLGVPGERLANVLALRTAADAVRLAAELEHASRVVVIGAGLIGLEVASVARAAGKDVTIVEASPQPFARLLQGSHVSSAIADLHRDHGSVVVTSTWVTELLGSDRVEQVVLSSGEKIATDLVVVAIGVVPAVEWLHGSGVRLDDGVVVDAGLRTEVHGVFAAGDVARVHQPSTGHYVRFEHYGSAQEQGIIAGRAMSGSAGTVTSARGAGSEQFGVRMQVIGEPRRTDRVVVRGDLAKRDFVAFFLHDGAVRAAFVMGRPRDAPAVRKLVTSCTRVDDRLLVDESQPIMSVAQTRPRPEAGKVT
jgi:3-phenylpropionate/trans-cinnamate dioxygenase ferredoxin reductase component